MLLLAPAPRAILISAAEATKYAAWATPVVGASGAVFGLFGALLVLNRHLGRSSTPLYAVLAVNIVFGFVYPGIAWQAHLGDSSRVASRLASLPCWRVGIDVPGNGRRWHWSSPSSSRSWSSTTWAVPDIYR